MTFTLDILTLLTWTAMAMLHQCEAGRPPPPAGLSYRWLDPFTVKVVWEKPSGLADGEVRYKYLLMKNAEYNDVVCTDQRHFIDTCLTEETGSDRWTYTVWTVGSKSCESLNESTRVSITIDSLKPRAEVRDVKCFIEPKKMNCSWIRGSQSLKLSYRICGCSKEHMNGLKECDQPYSGKTRSGCYLKADAISNDICMVVDTKDGMSTFRPAHVLHPPKLNIREEGDYLKLTWKPLKFENDCYWIYEVCFKKCDNPEVCQNFTTKGEPTQEPMSIAYDKSCLYEFRSRVMNSKYCKTMYSNFGDVVPYGTNELRDETLTVVAIVIPIILFLCIILSCYCFRRHSAIICPIIPDPSAIFKEMMMNGNKELKTTGSLYTPVPEAIEPCNVTLVTENSVQQQNS